MRTKLISNLVVVYTLATAALIFSLTACGHDPDQYIPIARRAVQQQMQCPTNAICKPVENVQ